jgi:hypothetical protein
LYLSVTPTMRGGSGTHCSMPEVLAMPNEALGRVSARRFAGRDGDKVRVAGK